jgi:glycosidase
VHALVVLFTIGGVPSVYAGDERGWTGVKEDREGGDDAIRPAFPPQPGLLSPDGAEEYRTHQLLIGVRRRHPWLVRAQTQPHTLANTAMSYTLTDPAGGGSLAAAVNLDDRPATLAVPPGNWTHAAGPGSVEGSGTVRLPALGWAIASSPDALRH